jgi:hypothetical protein
MKQFEDDKVTLDAGCAERSCACYSPQFGDTGGVPYYPESVVSQLLGRIAELEKQLSEMLYQKYGGVYEKQSYETVFDGEKYTTKLVEQQTNLLSEKDIQEYEYHILRALDFPTNKRVVGLERIIKAIEAKVRGEK